MTDAVFFENHGSAAFEFGKRRIGVFLFAVDFRDGPAVVDIYGAVGVVFDIQNLIKVSFGNGREILIRAFFDNDFLCFSVSQYFQRGGISAPGKHIRKIVVHQNVLDFSVNRKDNIALLQNFRVFPAFVHFPDHGNLLAVRREKNRNYNHCRHEVEKRAHKKHDYPLPRRHIVERFRIVVVVLFALKSAKTSERYGTYGKLTAPFCFSFINRRSETYRELVYLKTEFSARNEMSEFVNDNHEHQSEQRYDNV